MATTLETNLPHAESLVRNQSLGLRWVKHEWDVAPRIGYAVDTFGLHAQLPQILAQFGLRTLLANRCGGTNVHDLFRARGLDGTELTLASWNTYASHHRREFTSCGFYTNQHELDHAWAEADRLHGAGPRLFVPYTENEFPILLSFRAATAARHRPEAGQYWQLATPGDYLDAVQTARTDGLDLPVVPADLNPEFTGCFSLRLPLRMRNRAVEALVLDTESWAARHRLPAAAAALDDIWWDLAHVHFHDVFTGSHPTTVYHETMALLDRAAHAAEALFTRTLAPPPPPPDASPARWVVFNPLPWPRRERVQLAAARVDVDLPAGGHLVVEAPAATAAPPPLTAVNSAVNENEWIRLECDTVVGLRRLIWKPTGAVLLRDAHDLLVLQADEGNFQIEQPCGAEIGATSGSLRLETTAAGDQLVLSGTFPPIEAFGTGSSLHWALTFTLMPGRPALDLSVRLDWKGEAARVRLKLATTLDTGSALFEIPFGVVRRHAYTPRANAKGEWPAQRWVALEDAAQGHGLALANTGAAGVEALGGTLFTTLLRAPKSEYAGMVADDSSSQHGTHLHRFALIPYAGSWADAGVVRLAQALNHPPRVLPLSDDFDPATASPAGGIGVGAFHLEGDPSVVFSSLKPADDGSGDLILRCYETAGRNARAAVTLAGITHAHRSDLPERALAPMDVSNETLRLEFNPFEIVTCRFT
jgi:alpha-mannosidase